MLFIAFEWRIYFKKARSDASLLLGTILSCRRTDYLRIGTFQILIDTLYKDTLEEKKQDNEKQEFMNANASLVVTVSLHHLEKISKLYHEKSAKVPSFQHYDEYLSMRSGGLEACGQLMFSLIRSDCHWLEKAMIRLVALKQGHIFRPVHSNKETKQKHVFPPQMTLEDLYKRIRGASVNMVSDYSTLVLDSTESKKLAGSLTLPDDVLQNNIAPYLRAKSLNSLRQTCRYLHHILKSSVPGLKLKLFQHQVRSLEWMRKRENHQYTEDNIMMCKPNDIATDEVLCGDQYRSVTAGTIVSLVPRYGQATGSFWHINSWTGVASLDYKQDRVRNVAKCRNVARGGILSDDPGLGKTITVCSLILQTFGQMTGNDNLEEKITDDMIIDAYWTEVLVGYTRREQLIELTLKLRKVDLEGNFYYPVESLSSQEKWEDYKSLVEQPIW